MLPIIVEHLRFGSTGVGDSVIASRAFTRADFPVTRYEPAYMKSVEEWVDGALTCEQTTDRIPCVTRLRQSCPVSQSRPL